MITVNINKAKTVAHNKRRAARAEEFKPLDDLIAKQIPGMSIQEIEIQRQAIREKYAEKQVAIDAANTLDKIKEAL